MRSRDEISPARGGESSALAIDRSSKLWHLFSFINHSYNNNLTELLTSVNSFLVFDFLLKYTKNKNLKFAINTIKWGIPAFLHGSKFYLSFRSYLREVQDEKSPTFQKHIAKICKVLEVKESSPYYLNLNHIDCILAPEIILWLLNKPNTKNIKILSLHNFENTSEIDSINLSGNGQFDIGILFKYNDIKYVLDLTLLVRDSFSFVKGAIFQTASITNDNFSLKLREAFLYEFVSTLNIEKNILYFDHLESIKSEQRIKVDEVINQFDVPEFAKELKQILNCGRKRAYAFVSRPGTGKSTIIRKLEEIMTDYVFFKLTPNDLSTAATIKDRFNIIKNINKSIVVIEDLDSCDLHEKNSKAGVFLDEIDDVNNDLNIIIIVTINDTSRVHFSIINRPGRFDRVIEIKPPFTIEEILQVMISKANKLKQKYCPKSTFSIPKLTDIKELLEECLKYEFTQAEITNAVVEQIFIYISMGVLDKKLNWNKITKKQFNDFFKQAIESHKKTLQAIKNCNFNNAQPKPSYDDNDKQCQSSPASLVYPWHDVNVPTGSTR